MYQVDWVESAVMKLAHLWTESGMDRRAKITAASQRIDELLRHDPLEAGESRSQGQRVLIELPLAVTFQVNIRLKVATVLEVLASFR